jgi:hypothetical protein
LRRSEGDDIDLAETSRLRRARRIAVFLLVQIVGLAIAFEIACQIYASVLANRWETVKSHPAHFFRASENPVLGYELMPGYATVADDGRVLVINRQGLRDTREEFGGGESIAVIGDSVTFGMSNTQNDTISARLEGLLADRGRSAAVVNLGVPGYALAEIAEQQRVKDAVYHFGSMVYLFNPNDFARRDSRFEGADNGLYRMYRRPVFKSPWFVRKAIYRLAKRGVTGFGSLHRLRFQNLMGGNPRNTVEWYEWFFAGNEISGFAHLAAMVEYAKSEGIAFGVVFLPVGSAFEDGQFGLVDEYQSLGLFLEKRGVPYLDPTPVFAAGPGRFFDGTDHLSPTGDALVASILADFIESRLCPRDTGAPEVAYGSEVGKR